MPSPLTAVRLALRAPAAWTPARWGAALAGGALTALAIGVPTDVVPNPWFGRDIAITWWSYPVLVASALLAGLLLATYVRTGGPAAPGRARTPGRLGSAGGLLTLFAVGCPVCNKLVLLALGTSGALNLWAPLQPLMAVASLLLLAVATVQRLAGEVACPAPAASRA